MTIASSPLVDLSGLISVFVDGHDAAEELRRYIGKANGLVRRLNLFSTDLALLNAINDSTRLNHFLQCGTLKDASLSDDGGALYQRGRWIRTAPEDLVSTPLSSQRIAPASDVHLTR
jgi:hypothetical protein